MTSATTSSTHNAIGNTGLFGTKPRFVLGRTATWTVGLTQCTVQLSQFSQLHTTQIIMALWHFNALSNNVFYFVHRLFHGLRIGGSDESMKWFIFSSQWLTIFSSNFSLLHGSLAANNNLSACFFFHSLQSIATRTNQKSHKINVGMFFLGYQHFIDNPGHRGPAKRKI